MANAKQVDFRRAEAEQHTFASLIAELKTETVQFVHTRMQLFFSELRDKADKSKKGAMLGGVALVFGGIGFLMLTFAAVGLISVAFWGSPFAFFWGFLIIGIFYVMLASMAGIVAYYTLNGLAPQKTIQVLREDKAWVQAELTK